MTETFSTLLYDNRHLVIRNAPDKKPLVIAECYLPDIAETICRLLTDAKDFESDLEKTKKEDK